MNKQAIGKLMVALPLMLSLVGPVSAETDTLTESLSQIELSSLEQRFIGSWSVNIIYDGNNKPTTPALYSFLDGGVLYQSENPMVDPMLGNLVFSNAHGAWETDVTDGRFRIRYFKLVYQPDASFWGREESTGTLVLDADGNLSGSISFGGETARIEGKKITAAVDDL